MEINLDPQLIRDLSVLVAVSAAAGFIMESMGQPSINGYFIAGSLVGPGGLGWIREIVQVQSLAQIGVQLLLFSLGLEFSLSRLRAVRNVAIFGGLIQISALSALSGLAASILGISAYQGAFVGALVSMSSTSIVVKCLMESRTSHMQHAQITIGTLVLQDCVVGLLFAFMPVLAKAAGGSRRSTQVLQLGDILGVTSQVMIKLAIVIAIAVIVARTFLPMLTKVLVRYSTEASQMAMLSFCLCTAMVTARLGISAEVGSFLAGAMISATDHSETALHHIEPMLHFFMALFISSTGLVMSPTFLLHHLPVLASSVMVIMCVKSIIIALVVMLFRYPSDTAMAVGINLAQIGEFSFVLFSLAAQNRLIGSQVYLLLMGVTALSLLLTPFLLQVSIRLLSKVARGGGVDVEMANIMVR